MSDTTIRRLICGYAFISLIVFGNAYNNIRADMVRQDRKFAIEEAAVSGALICAVGWPLYLSAKAWEHRS